MKTIVVYKSRSGFVKRYAQWIAEDLSADLLEGSRAAVDHLAGYDTVIYGGGLYEAGINGVKLITANMDKLAGKKIIVFASGATPERQDAMDHVISHNFTPEQLDKLRFFYLRGGFNFSKLAKKDKLLMTLLKWKIKWKKARNISLVGDEIGMLAAYDKPADFVRRRNIADLVEYARQ